MTKSLREAISIKNNCNNVSNYYLLRIDSKRYYYLIVEDLYCSCTDIILDKKGNVSSLYEFYFTQLDNEMETIPYYNILKEGYKIGKARINKLINYFSNYNY